MSVVNRSFDHPLELEEQASMSLAGGLANHGYQCGMLWGATLAAGAQAYRMIGPGPHAETAAIGTAQNIVAAFRTRTKNEINCLEITDLNLMGKPSVLPILKFFAKGGPIACFLMAAGYAHEAYDTIHNAFAENSDGPPAPPISCAALLAQKMDASDKHVVMSAGLAGGIGLSGGACGALGAAVWLIGLHGRQNDAEKKDIDTRISGTIDRFLKDAADFEFECAKIVGRTFERVDDHAAYLRGGGCAELIKIIAS